MSFPEKTGQIPVYYGHKPSGGRSSQWEDYVDGSSKPLFPFGYGLSYTTFEYSNLRISPEKISADGEVTVKADVKNTGKVAGDEVVQLYIKDIIATSKALTTTPANSILTIGVLPPTRARL